MTDDPLVALLCVVAFLIGFYLGFWLWTIDSDR